MESPFKELKIIIWGIWFERINMADSGETRTPEIFFG
jgi:hypothetical protein